MNAYSQSIIDKLKELEPVLREQYGITRLRVFGSVARGEAEPGSDVDLIADFEPVPSLFQWMDYRQAMKDEIGAPVDLLTERSIDHYLKKQILSEARDVLH
jgi:predicted nucleotidyltransferase